MQSRRFKMRLGIMGQMEPIVPGIGLFGRLAVLPFGMNRFKLYAMSVLGNLSAGIFVFTVPRVFAADAEGLLAGALTGVCMMGGYFLTAFLAGHASDRFGFRRTMTVGSLCSIAAALVALQADNLPTLYVAMAFLGAGNGIIFPAIMAALTSTCRHEETPGVLLAYTFSWNVGLMLGVPTGGWLFDAENGRHWAFGTALVAGIVTLGLALLQKEAKGGEDAMEDPPTTASGLPPMAFAVLGWIGLFGAILSIAHLQFLFPKLAREMGMPEKVQSVMMVIHRALGLSFYLIMFYWNGWRFRKWPIIAANFFGITGLCLLFLAENLSASFVAYVLCAPFTSITYYCAITYAASAFPKEKKGLASGINESIISAGFVLGPLVGGVIGDGMGDFRLPFAILAAFLIAMTVSQQVVAVIWKGRMSGGGRS